MSWWGTQGRVVHPPGPTSTFFQHKVFGEWHYLVQSYIVSCDGHPPVCIQEEAKGRNEEKAQFRGLVVTCGSLVCLAGSPSHMHVSGPLCPPCPGEL